MMQTFSRSTAMLSHPCRNHEHYSGFEHQRDRSAQSLMHLHLQMVSIIIGDTLTNLYWILF